MATSRYWIPTGFISWPGILNGLIATAPAWTMPCGTPTLLPAYEIYKFTSSAWQKRVSYARERVNQPFDFTVDEQYQYDREEEPWAASTGRAGRNLAPARQERLPASEAD